MHIVQVILSPPPWWKMCTRSLLPNDVPRSRIRWEEH